MNGTILGMKKHEVYVKFDEIVAFSELEQFIDTPVKRYSSGMYVRLAFAFDMRKIMLKASTCVNRIGIVHTKSMVKK